MTELLKQINFFIESGYDFEIKNKSQKKTIEIWVDGYVYSYQQNGKFISKMAEYLYEKMK